MMINHMLKIYIHTDSEVINLDLFREYIPSLDTESALNLARAAKMPTAVNWKICKKYVAEVREIY